MTSAGYAWWVGDQRTGLLTGRLPVAQSSWSDVMDDAGQMQPTVPLADDVARRLNLYVSAEPCRCFVALAYTDKQGVESWLQGGPIWTHDYDDASMQLQIGGAGLRSLWDHRYVLPALTAGETPSSVTTAYTGLSLGTIAKRLVQQAQSWTGGDVPVVFPDDEGGTSTRTYPGYGLSKVGDMLTNLTGVQGGPEIQFVPRRSTTDPRKLEWVMRVGTTATPLLTQSGNDWKWDASAVRGSVAGISVKRDGTVMATDAYVQGSGSEAQTLWGVASSSDLLDAGFPRLELEQSGHEQNGDTTQLGEYATAAQVLASRPAESWTLTVERDGQPTVGAYAVGDWVTVTVGDNHPYLPAGDYRSRISSKAGDDTTAVKLTLATMQGAI